MLLVVRRFRLAPLLTSDVTSDTALATNASDFAQRQRVQTTRPAWLACSGNIRTMTKDDEDEREAYIRRREQEIREAAPGRNPFEFPPFPDAPRYPFVGEAYEVTPEERHANDRLCSAWALILEKRSRALEELQAAQTRLENAVEEGGGLPGAVSELSVPRSKLSRAVHGLIIANSESKLVEWAIRKRLRRGNLANPDAILDDMSAERQKVALAYSVAVFLPWLREIRAGDEDVENVDAKRWALRTAMLSTNLAVAGVYSVWDPTESAYPVWQLAVSQAASSALNSSRVRDLLNSNSKGPLKAACEATLVFFRGLKPGGQSVQWSADTVEKTYRSYFRRGR